MNAPATRAFGPVRQLGYVVEDLGTAVDAWTTQLAVGPWMIIRNVELEATYLGEPTRPVIDLALSYRGDVQIELIQQKNDARSPYKEFIDKGRYGLHHIAFLCEPIEEHVAHGKAAGLKLVFDINMPMGGGRYVYFASPVPGEQTYIELLQASSTMKQMFAAGIPSAAEWQGQGKPMEFNMGPLLKGLRWISKVAAKLRPAR